MCPGGEGIIDYSQDFRQANEPEVSGQLEGERGAMALGAIYTLDHFPARKLHIRHATGPSSG